LAKVSAGLLPYRLTEEGPEVLIGRMGGPFWTRPGVASWTIFKGLIERQETSLEAACREFFEETGARHSEPLIALGQVIQKSGKVVHAWAFESALDPDSLTSNFVSVGGRAFREIDEFGWFNLSSAAEKMVAGQSAFLERLAAFLRAPETRAGALLIPRLSGDNDDDEMRSDT
jgi:predicted NUDIX family NTP pyrophosphohydrolase